MVLHRYSRFKDTVRAHGITIVSQGVQMWQGHRYHEKEVAQAETHHKQAMGIERESMRKENLHDIWEQKNNQVSISCNTVVGFRVLEPLCIKNI